MQSKLVVVCNRVGKRVVMLSLLMTILACVPGCNTRNSGIVTSIDDLTADYQYGGLLLRPKQLRMSGVNGLMPIPTVGQVIHFSPHRGPSTLVGISPDSKNSYRQIITVNSKSDYTISDLTPIRNKILAAQAAALELVAAQLDRARAQAIDSHSQIKSPGSTPDPITVPNPAAETVTETETVDGEDADGTAAVADADTTGAAEPEDSTQTKKITGTPLQIAEIRYAAARDKFDRAMKTATKAVSTPGVIVFRWTTTDQTATKGKAGGIFSGAFNQRRQQSGYVIAAGIRQVTLLVGRDIQSIDPEIGHDSTVWPLKLLNFNKNKRMLITHCTQAKHLIYLSQFDLEAAVELQLKASAKQLGALGATLSELDEVQIGLTISKAQSLSNLGVISEGKLAYEIVDWGPYDNENNLDGTTPSATVPTSEEGWHTFHAVGARYSDLGYLINHQFGKAHRDHKYYHEKGIAREKVPVPKTKPAVK